MQPEEGVLSSQMERLYEEGRWEELERLEDEILERDSADARTAYRLGNLLALQKRYEDAVPLYEKAWAQRWPGALAYNNKGVALACMGEARAAFTTLREALAEDPRCGPASYNLAVLLEKLGREGTLPQVLLDLHLGERGQKAGDLARKYLDAVKEAEWPALGPQEYPLLLWLDDLRPGFGFEPVPELGEIADAEELYEEGIALFRAEEWEKAIEKLEAAARLHSAFVPRIKSYLTRARIELVRRARGEARQLWDEGNHKEASQVLDSLVGLGSDLPNQAFAEEILAAGIRDLAGRIRKYSPAENWRLLQTLITAARHRVEAARPPVEAATSGAETVTPGQEGSTPSNSEIELEDEDALLLQQACRKAWDAQIEALILKGDFDEAAQLIEFSEVQWFAKNDLPRWRRRVFTAQAEAFRAEGLGLRDEHDLEGAVDRWSLGREAAVKAEDQHLIDSLDTLIGPLATLDSEIGEKARNILRGDRSELERCKDALDLNPGDSRLIARRDALAMAVLNQAEDALDAGLLDHADLLAVAVIKAKPGDERALRVQRQVQKGNIERWIDEAAHALAMGKLEEAGNTIQKVLKIDPTHPGALALKRDTDAAKVVEKRAADGKGNAYDNAFLGYQAKREANEPDDKALEFVREMRRLDPRSAQTREASQWYCEAKVEAVRRDIEERLAEDEDLKVEDLEKGLKAVFAFNRNYQPARDLREELRRESRAYSQKRRKKILGELEEAERALLNGHAQTALDVLAAILYRDPDLEGEIRELREEALTLLRTEIEAHLRKPGGQGREKARALLEACEPWDPAFVAAKRKDLAGLEAKANTEKEIAQGLAELRKRLSAPGLRGKPLRALSEIEAQERRWTAEEGQELRALIERELAAERRRILSEMNLIQRAWLRLRGLGRGTAGQRREAMLPNARKVGLFLVTALLLGSWVEGQSAKKKEPAQKPSQYWIVLLDVSLSSERRDREISAGLGAEGYRLRNETLSLLQTALAARQKREQGTLDDYLDVYVFGEQVKQVTQLPIHPVVWDDIKSEDWWETVIPTDIGARTNYVSAIQQAVETFKVKHKDSVKNLVLISDGELDMPGANRPSRGKMTAEEIDSYRNFLRPDNPFLAWMNEHDVAVYTFAMDEELTGAGDQARQDELRARLFRTRLGGSSPLERALQMVEKLNAGAGRDGLLPESEGPYVMQGLADHFAERTRGNSRSVRPDNIFITLWSTVFPDESHQRVLPPETKTAILFAPLESPVQVKLRKDGVQSTVSLRYDRTSNSYAIDPPEAREDVDVKLKTTSHYSTWQIASLYLDEIEPNPVIRLLEEEYSLLPFGNLQFVWQENKPPQRILAKQGVELAVDLVWEGEKEGPSVEEWRQTLRAAPRKATGRVSGPAGGPWEVTYRTEVPQDNSNTVLRLHARFAHTAADGIYRAGAELKVGPADRVWERKAPPVSFLALASSPLSEPDRFALGFRIQREGKPGELIPLPAPPAGQSLPPLEITSKVPARLILQWSVDSKQKCEDVDQLQISVPELDRTFGASQNQLRGRPLLEGDRLVCFRSAPEKLPDDAYGRVMKLKVTDGLAQWERQIAIRAPMPLWQRALLWLGLFLLALVVVAGLAWMLSPALRDWVRERWAILKADFPLALETRDGERLEWHRGQPKRFLVSVDGNGQVQMEATKGGLYASDSGFEVRPFSSYEYIVKPLAGPGWTLRKVSRQGNPSSKVLAPGGEVMSLIELTRGTHFEIRQGTVEVILRHKSL